MYLYLYDYTQPWHVYLNWYCGKIITGMGESQDKNHFHMVLYNNTKAYTVYYKRSNSIPWNFVSCHDNLQQYELICPNYYKNHEHLSLNSMFTVVFNVIADNCCWLMRMKHRDQMGASSRQTVLITFVLYFLLSFLCTITQVFDDGIKHHSLNYVC